MKKLGIVFSHAHWDIEWYMPFSSYRFWLVDVMDMLFDTCEKKPGFRTYMLDGQVSPVEHYLQVRPEDEDKIKRLIKQGKLSIGPFYTQFDEWLISGESIVRNCLYGLKKGSEFGEIMKAGYLPDNFGHPLQMPQILKGFDIDSLIFMRGMPEKEEGMGDEFYIRGLDGSKILGIHLSRTYGNAVNLWSREGVDPMTLRIAPYNESFIGFENQVERIIDLDVEKVAREMIDSARKELKNHPSGVAPLAFGCDHCPPTLQLPDIIEMANKLQDEIEFVQGNCEDIVDAIKARQVELPTFDKELWGARYQFLLTGTLSTRTYIKQNNFSAENLLEKYAEPLASICSVYGKKYPSAMFEEAWRFMFLNHAHDSIHGSSVDPVHIEMMQRFEAAKQIAVGISHDSLKYLASIVDPWWKKYKAGIISYNPMNIKSKNSIMDVWISTGEEEFHIEDKNGNILPMQIIKNPNSCKDTKKVSNSATWPNDKAKHILFTSLNPDTILESYAVVPGTVNFPLYNNGKNHLENEFVQVTFTSGSLDILDKVSGKWYKGVNIIEEEGDAGDAWDFSEPLEYGEKYSSSKFPSSCTLIESGPVRSTLQIDTMMIVPYHLEVNRRSDKIAELPIKTTVSLYEGSKRVEVSVEIDNQALDHRMRLKCGTSIKTEVIKSQGHFGIIERSVKYPYSTEGWMQKPETYHFRDWAAADDEKHGLAIACKGLYEYGVQNKDEEETELYVTLLRGVGIMSRNVIKSRNNGEASPPIPIPNAQCTGIQKFEYAFIPYSCEGDGVSFIDEANAFLYPTLSHLIRDKQRKVTADVEKPLFKVEPGNLQVSTFKLSENKDGYILRIWENEGKETKAKLCISSRFSRVFRTNLKEGILEELIIKEGNVNINLGAYKIETLKLL